MSSNAAKYADPNPVVGGLLDRFYTRVRTLVAPLAPQDVLDAGCGEGFGLTRLAPVLPGRITGFDLSEQAVERARRAHPAGSFSIEDITALPYEDGAFDLVICMEVLEHLPEPTLALRELKRVSRGHLVLSVPHEPWFQLGNLVRGQWTSTWGNHPEHIQHWGRRSFGRFLDTELRAVEIHGSFPWILARARAR